MPLTLFQAVSLLTALVWRYRKIFCWIAFSRWFMFCLIVLRLKSVVIDIHGITYKTTRWSALLAPNSSIPITILCVRKKGNESLRSEKAKTQASGRRLRDRHVSGKTRGCRGVPVPFGLLVTKKRRCCQLLAWISIYKKNFEITLPSTYN